MTDSQPVSVQRQQELERYLQPKPSDLAAYLELAEIYRKQNRPVEARRTLTKALEVHPDEPQIVWQLEEASLAASMQQLQQVAELAQRLGTPEAQRELERAQTDWACRRVDVCKARLGRDPSNVGLRIVIAESLKELGRFDEALREAEAATENIQHAPAAHLIRGQCFQATNKLAEALVAYRAAAMRKACPAPPKVRVVAMHAAVDLATTLGFTQTKKLYMHHLQLAETASAAEGKSPTPDPAKGI